MKKWLLVASFLFASLPFTNPVFADDANFAVKNLEPHSCFLTEQESQEAFDYFNGGNSTSINGETLHLATPGTTYVPGEVMMGVMENEIYAQKGNEDWKWKLLSKNDDLSKIQLVRLKNQSQPFSQIVSVVCYKMTVSGEGNLDGNYSANEDYPQSLEAFYKLLRGKLRTETRLLSSDPNRYLVDNRMAELLYSNKAEGGNEVHVPDALLEKGEAVIYGMESYMESDYNPGETFDLWATINNGFSMTSRMFHRPYFGQVRDYNEGSTLLESDYSDNYAVLKSAVTVGNDHLAAPKITSSNSKNGVISVKWTALDGAKSYAVKYIRDDSKKIEMDYYTEHFETTDSTISVNIDQNPDFSHCVLVSAVNAEGISGPSDRACFGQVFTDVPEGEWYAPWVEKAYASNILSGYKTADNKLTGHFGPADNITNAEALKLALNATDRAVYIDSFPFDLPDLLPANLQQHWAKDFIYWAAMNHFDLVADLNHFDPDAPITRAELVNLLLQALQNPVPMYNQYSFVDTANNKYKNEIEYFAQLGVVSGQNNGDHFTPDQSLKRSEAAKVLVAMTEKFLLSAPGVSLSEVSL